MKARRTNMPGHIGPPANLERFVAALRNGRSYAYM
jgi:hypothetical protein